METRATEATDLLLGERARSIDAPRKRPHATSGGDLAKPVVRREGSCDATNFLHSTK
jgi:hypothetical protein